jgi:putative ABC transport system substrate-binding protein
LLSYGNERVVISRRAATYVDRILRGAKPGDLPVQFPAKFELVINLQDREASPSRKHCWQRQMR